MPRTPRHQLRSPQDRRTSQDQHDADGDRALERKHRRGADLALLVAALVGRDARTRRGLRRRRLRRVTLRLFDGFLVRIRRVGIGAAILQARLQPVELRRRRGHIGVGFSRRTPRLNRGAAEIVGIRHHVAEAHARRRLVLRRVLIGTARHARGRGLRRLWTRRRRRRWRNRRRIDAKVTRRPRLRSLFLPISRCGGRRRDRLTSARRGCVARLDVGADAGAERISGAAAVGIACARDFTGALGGFGLDLAHSLFERQPLAGDFGFAQRRLHAAQLRDQRRARPLIKRAAALAGGTGIQSGNGARDQRIVISHSDSS